MSPAIQAAFHQITAAEIAVEGHVRLHRAALVIGNPEQVKRTRADCEAAFEALLDALEAGYRAARAGGGH